MSAAGSAIWLPDWPAPPGVHACVTLRHGAGVSAAPYDHFNLGARCGDVEASVEHNRATLRDIAGLPDEPCWLQQVHGSRVVEVDAAMAGRARAPLDSVAEADAAVTGDADVVLAVLTADCLPVLFCADDGRRLAVAHAGWRGLANGVLEATVAAMGVRADQILAWLGPAAGPQAYEVGDEVREALMGHSLAVGEAFRPTRAGHWLCDLYLIARLRLLKLGVGHVVGGQACTISQPDLFFSYRRTGATGRMATLIWRNDGEA